MAIICENVINTGMTVKNTIIHVYNWNHGGCNVDTITLVFDNDESISYATEMMIELPNGDYKYENGEYILIEGSNIDSDINMDLIEEQKLKLDYSKVLAYIEYVLNTSEDKKFKRKIQEIVKILTIENYNEILTLIDKEISNYNNSVDTINDKFITYISYLKSEFNKIMEHITDNVDNIPSEILIEELDNLSETIEKLINKTKNI